VTPDPWFEFHPGAVTRAIEELRGALRGATVAYAVKANPHPLLLEEVRRAGATVEIASPAERGLVVAAGFSPAQVLSTNPVRPVEHSVDAMRAGLRTFVVDSADEIERLTRAARTAGTRPQDIAVLVRLAVPQDHAAMPLGGKFGVTPGVAVELAELSTSSDLTVAGVAFHTGSQVRHPDAFAVAAAAAAAVLERLEAAALLPDVPVVDLGGGWPADYPPGAPRVADLAAAALDGLGRFAGARLVVEPGRFLAAPALSLHAHVWGTAERAGRRWAHLDVGVYNGVIDPAFSPEVVLPARCPGRGGPTTTWTLAGPTCDSLDVIVADAELPEALRDGDEVVLDLAGAYSVACASSFNGFDPPEVRLAPGRT
jgi:ornithine decarboxylase